MTTKVLFRCDRCGTFQQRHPTAKKCSEGAGTGPLIRYKQVTPAESDQFGPADDVTELAVDLTKPEGEDGVDELTERLSEFERLEGAAESVPVPVTVDPPPPPPEQAAEPDRPRKPYVSPTQLNSYFRCGEAYRRRYLEGERIPPGVAAHRGTGMHQGAKLNFRQKLETYRDLPPADIVDAAVAAFEAAVEKEGYLLTPDEAARGEKAVVAAAKDDTATFAEAYATLQAPLYQPVEVEQPVRIELPTATHDLFGYVDLVATPPPDSQLDMPTSIVDFKTSTKSKPQSEADDSLQLTYYSAAYQVRHGRPADDVRLDVLVRRAKGVGRQLLVTKRDAGDYSAFVARVNAMLAGVTAGIFTPALPGSWWCSAKFCGYWSTCPYVNAKRQQAGESFDA